MGMNDYTRANISEHCKWVEEMLDKEHEAEIKELTEHLEEGIKLMEEADKQIKELKDQRERRVKSWKKAEAEQEQQIKELGRKNAILATFLGERNRQIKELKDFAKHKDSCQYWADVKAVKSNMLPNLKPNCNCGLKQALK
jgi:DNA repair exonuclease SbcCD ATPase subunit